MRDFTILILSNSKSDLSKIHFKEFVILNINSKEFKDICKTSSTSEKIHEEIDKDIFDKSERFALINKNRTKKIGIKRIYDVYHFLLILFPSSLKIEYILNYQVLEKEIRFESSFKTDAFNYYKPDNLLYFDEKDLYSINNFIDAYYDEYLKNNYLKNTIQHYWNGFETNYYHFSFLAFCISLESIINGRNELIYRIARSVAIIVGEDEATSEIVFKNIKLIYDLRSKIVHGIEFDDDLVNEYLQYLQNIASKIIIELLIHGIENIDVLNYKITKIGFGDRSKISDNWKEYNLNESQDNIIKKKLPKKITE